MYVGYRFEISTQPEYFARWFDSTVTHFMPMHMEIDSKRGVAKLHAPDKLSVTGNIYQWIMTSHEYYDERFASRPKYDTKRLHLQLLHMMPPEIGYRAKAPAPGRLQVVLWCQGEELIADLRSVVSEIEETYGLTLRTIDDELDAAAIAAQIHSNVESVSADETSDGEAVRFTPKESDVADLVALGYSAAQICEKLIMEPNTLRAHLGNMKEKIKVVEAIPSEKEIGLPQLADWLRAHNYPCA